MGFYFWNQELTDHAKLNDHCGTLRWTNSRLCSVSLIFHWNWGIYMLETEIICIILYEIRNFSLSPVVTCVQCISTALICTELQREKRVFTPRNIGVNMNLVLWLGQMSEPLATDRSQVYLRSSGQMHRPVFVFARHLSSANQFVGCSAQKVATRLVTQRPATWTIFGEADLEATSWITFFRFTQHVAKRVDGQIFS